MNHDEQAIRDLVALWHRATAADDVETVLGLMADDAVFLVAGRPPMIGRSTFERGLRDLLAQHRIESTHRIRELGIGADLAYCWSELSVRILPRTGNGGGAAETHGGSALSILRKQGDGRWLLIRDANLLGTAPR